MTASINHRERDVRAICPHGAFVPVRQAVARRKISLGHHQKIDDAIAARAEAEARHFGRFAHNAALRAVARLADRT